MDDKTKKVLEQYGAEMQRAWNGIVRELEGMRPAATEPDLIVHLNGVALVPREGEISSLMQRSLLAVGWLPTEEGFVACLSPVRADEDPITATFDKELAAFRNMAVADASRRFHAFATVNPEGRLRIEVRAGFAPWSPKGSFPTGEALRAAYFSPEVLAAREDIEAEEGDAGWEVEP